MSDSPSRKRNKPEVAVRSHWIPKSSNKVSPEEINRKMNKFLESSDWSWNLKPNGQHLLQGNLYGRALTVSWYPQTGTVLFQGKESDAEFFKNRWDSLD